MDFTCYNNCVFVTRSLSGPGTCLPLNFFSWCRCLVFGQRHSFIFIFLDNVQIFRRGCFANNTLDFNLVDMNRCYNPGDSSTVVCYIFDFFLKMYWCIDYRKLDHGCHNSVFKISSRHQCTCIFIT